MSGLTIIGLAKLLAYGDFLKAKASQRNETIFAVLDKEIAKYPYSRKSEPKVGEGTNHWAIKLREGNQGQWY